MRMKGEKVMDRISHLSDQNLLLLADGELSRKSAAQARAHVLACWSCRARLRKLEGTIEAVASVYAGEVDSASSPVAGSRAVLKARLSELAMKSRPSLWSRISQRIVERPKLVYALAVLVAAVGLGLPSLRQFTGSVFKGIFFQPETAALPNSRLTPGATRSVSMGDICSVSHEEVVRPVSSSLQSAVLQKYGLRNARIQDYEIDYLITPGLGGADDINNLWPEPNSSTAWNAHVKDVLEDRLHQMVCAGKVDLPTAQHDIAANWISAYRKYLHSDKPASFDSRSDRHQRTTG
jgi:anti-sigma factor RsiW